MSKLITRALSGALYVALVVGSVLTGAYGLYILGGLLLFFAIKEGGDLVKFNGPKAILIVPGLILYNFLVLNRLLELNVPSELWMILLPFFYGVILLTKAESGAQWASKQSFLFLYIVFPVSLFVPLYSQLEISHSGLLILYVFITIWANDTFAYLSGSALGKHKIWPAVSPGKSWEGFAGGFVASLVVGYIAGLNFSILTIGEGLIFGGLISLFATIGDFFESALKRHAGVKDSGNILPGHGGILDRIDSILFVIPAVFAYLLLLQKITF
ncbi:phosphatidate cytidylyltransferase [Luteibaculum oceani]|uniref:phosphatidate cytidylyltransferase n=1 Tax=Luteibaculum oceani TaxID=1294296 RepID=UPI0014774F12|nr:phosphatidate cytidylyltransferase [Luteibaculum oceani]